MKEIVVSAFTEEYEIIVVIGTIKELTNYLYKETRGRTKGQIEEIVSQQRGGTWDRLKTANNHPIISINGDLPVTESLPALAHEASHAASYIMDYIGLEDPSDEFKGHIISAVMRQCMKKLKIK